MIDPNVLKIVARVSLAFFAFGTLCTVLRFLTDKIDLSDDENTSDRWKFMASVLNAIGLIVAAFVTLMTARLS